MFNTIKLIRYFKDGFQRIAVVDIASLRQVRYIFRAETITGQGLTVPHQSRKRYTFLNYYV